MTKSDTTLALTVLASGSSGNASVIHHSSGALLLDAGVSARQIVLRMHAAELDPHDLAGIIVTHEHGDHVRGVRVLAQKLGVPVFTTEGTAGAVGLDSMAVEVHTIACGDTFTAGHIDVSVLDTSHDATEPIGCMFESAGGNRIGVVTDSGMLTDSAREIIPDCDVLGLECNHDEHMLENGPYPWFLKNRILSATGHLSNAAAASAVRSLVDGRLSSVVALHISKTNNTPPRAREALADALSDAGSSAAVSCATETTLPVTCSCGEGIPIR